MLSVVGINSGTEGNERQECNDRMVLLDGSVNENIHQNAKKSIAWQVRNIAMLSRGMGYFFFRHSIPPIRETGFKSIFRYCLVKQKALSPRSLFQVHCTGVTNYLCPLLAKPVFAKSGSFGPQRFTSLSSHFPIANQLQIPCKKTRSRGTSKW